MKLFENVYLKILVPVISILVIANFILATGLLGVMSTGNEFLGLSSLYNLINNNPYIDSSFINSYLTFFRQVLNVFMDFKPLITEDFLTFLTNLLIDYLQIITMALKMLCVTFLLIVYWLILLVYLVTTFFYFITGGYVTRFPDSNLPDIFLTRYLLNTYFYLP